MNQPPPLSFFYRAFIKILLWWGGKQMSKSRNVTVCSSPVSAPLCQSATPPHRTNSLHLSLLHSASRPRPLIGPTPYTCLCSTLPVGHAPSSDQLPTPVSAPLYLWATPSHQANSLHLSLLHSASRPHLLISPTPYTCLCSTLPVGHAPSSDQLPTPVLHSTSELPPHQATATPGSAHSVARLLSCYAWLPCVFPRTDRLLPTSSVPDQPARLCPGCYRSLLALTTSLIACCRPRLSLTSLPRPCPGYYRSLPSPTTSSACSLLFALLLCSVAFPLCLCCTWVLTSPVTRNY